MFVKCYVAFSDNEFYIVRLNAVQSAHAAYKPENWHRHNKKKRINMELEPFLCSPDHCIFQKVARMIDSRFVFCFLCRQWFWCTTFLPMILRVLGIYRVAQTTSTSSFHKKNVCTQVGIVDYTMHHTEGAAYTDKRINLVNRRIRIGCRSKGG